jgi:hypothetical protein
MPSLRDSHINTPYFVSKLNGTYRAPHHPSSIILHLSSSRHLHLLQPFRDVPPLSPKQLQLNRTLHVLAISSNYCRGPVSEEVQTHASYTVAVQSLFESVIVRIPIHAPCIYRLWQTPEIKSNSIRPRSHFTSFHFVAYLCPLQRLIDFV